MSSKEQEQEGYSVEAQDRYLRDYCGRAGLKASKVFYISESASKADQRKTFNEAIAYLKKHRIQNFVCEKVDRLLRNFRDVVMVEDWLAADEARRLHLPKNSLVLHKNSASQDKFIWGMHVVVAKNYADNLSEEVRKGQLEKLRQGWLPGVPPIGYTNVKHDGKTIQSLSGDAPLVLQLFKLAATGGYTLQTLSEEMARRGLLLDGRPLPISMLHRMLHNPYYTGALVWNGKTYVGSHEPIVSQRLFDEVQQAIGRPLKQFPKQRRHYPLFQGLVTCASCGGLLVWETQKGHWYGKCPKPRSCSRQRFIREESVEQQVIESLTGFASPEANLLKWLREGLDATVNEELNSRQQATASIAEASDRLKAKERVLYEDRLDGRVSAEAYDAIAGTIRTQRAELGRQMKALEAEDTSYLERGLSFVALTQNAAGEYQTSTDRARKRELITTLHKSLVLDGERIEPEYTPQSRWVLSNILRRQDPENPKVEPADSGSTKQKRAPSGAPNPNWLGLRNDIRTLFPNIVNS